MKSTKQITKAMQMVAASKMRRAQEADKATQPYSRLARELLTHFAAQGIVQEHRWFAKRPVKTRMIILIASDKGLAGAYNTNVFKEYLQLLKRDHTDGVHNQTIAVGRKPAACVAVAHGSARNLRRLAGSPRGCAVSRYSQHRQRRLRGTSG